MPKPPTILTVAKRAQVSPSTVSRVLSKTAESRASRETKQRILDVANELNYRPHALARSLRVKKSFALAMYIPNWANPVFTEIIRGAQDTASERGYALFVSHLDEHAVRERLYRNLLSEGRVDGLILATALLEDSVIDDLVENEHPFLLLNRRSRATENSVSIDDEEGAVLAMEHLLRHGHRRIACLSGPLMFDTALRRLKGYRRALHTHDIPYEGALVEEIGWGTFDEGAEGMLRLLERTNPPTAVFASSFMVAVGALHAARNRNFRIPEDISIIGFHDAPLAKVTAPPLTVVNMPLYQMGREGITNLVAALTEDAPVKPKVLPPIGVVVRESTGPPNADS